MNNQRVIFVTTAGGLSHKAAFWMARYREAGFRVEAIQWDEMPNGKSPTAVLLDDAMEMHVIRSLPVVAEPLLPANRETRFDQQFHAKPRNQWRAR